MTRNYQIGIVSHSEDFHVFSVRSELEKRKNVNCHIFLSDKISGRKSINWELNENSTTYLLNSANRPVNLHDINLVWWRRASQKQKIFIKGSDSSYADLIENDCQAAFAGIFHTAFHGVWVNDPIRTIQAENKLYQLQIAKECGFMVPETLISQDKRQILDFCKKHNYKVVLKPVKGTTQVPLFTMPVKHEHLKSKKNLELCPAIFQQYIQGTEHLRINVFGKRIFAFKLISKELDWRKNIDIPIELSKLPRDFKSRLLKVMKRLGLKMGVFDFKINTKG